MPRNKGGRNNKPAQAQGRQGNQGKQQSYCNHCKKNGHNTNDCRSNNQNQHNNQQRYPNNKHTKTGEKRKSPNPCKHCGDEWHHGHKCGQAQKGGGPSRACRYCGEDHYDNQCSTVSREGKHPIQTTLLCKICSVGVHAESYCPLVLKANQNMPAFAPVLATRNDFISGDEEEEGPQYIDAQEPRARPELDPPFGFGTWDGEGQDPEMLPDAPPLVEEYVPCNCSNHSSWLYYRYQEEATRQLRLQQQQQLQWQRQFVYSPPQPFGMPFSDWRNYRY